MFFAANLLTVIVENGDIRGSHSRGDLSLVTPHADPHQEPLAGFGDCVIDKRDRDGGRRGNTGRKGEGIKR